MNKVAQAVVDTARARGAERIVLGLPRNMDGTEGARAQKSRKLGEKISQLWGREVVMWDERRTTVSAAAILAENDVFGKKRKQLLDSVSATVILEGYMAWRRNHPEEA